MDKRVLVVLIIVIVFVLSFGIVGLLYGYFHPLLAVPFIIPIGLIIKVGVDRTKEIKEGEEDDISNY